MFERVLFFFLLLFVVFFPAERLLPARPGQRALRRGWFHDLLHFALNPIVINAGAALVIGLLAAVIVEVVPESVRGLVGAQPFLLQFLEVFLLAEVCGYWAHRLAHQVPWLWRLHAVHHSTEELDWMAAHRQHPIEAIYMLGAANLPIFVMGFSLESLAWFVLLQKIYTAFVHANVRLYFGPLRFLFASPAFHHWHHARDPAAHNKNYSAVFPFLDVLFGTYKEPNQQFPEACGTADPVPKTWWGQLAYPFRAKIRSTRNGGETT